MILQTIARSITPALSIEELRAHLRVSDPGEDQLLEAVGRAAIAALENYTQSPIIFTTISARGVGPFHFPPTFRAIVGAFNAAGDAISFSGATVTIRDNRATIVALSGADRIVITAGYGDGNNPPVLPAPLKMAALHLARSLYDNPDAYGINQLKASDAYYSLLNPYCWHA